MNFETITWIRLIAGVVFLIAELALPGLVVVFLGMGAILTACLRWTGVLTGEITSITT